MENTLETVEMVSVVTESVLDKVVTRKEAAVAIGGIVGGVVVYKLAKYGWKRGKAYLAERKFQKGLESAQKAKEAAAK